MFIIIIISSSIIIIIMIIIIISSSSSSSSSRTTLCIINISISSSALYTHILYTHAHAKRRVAVQVGVYFRGELSGS